MFKIGDKVKVLPGGSYGHCLEIGSIAEVVDDCITDSNGEMSVTVHGPCRAGRMFAGEEVQQLIHPSELELVETNLLTDEEIQVIDDQTHFHESHDWSIRFARNVLKAAEDKKMGNSNVLG